MPIPEKVIRDLVEIACHSGKPADLTYRAQVAIRKMPTDRLERLEVFTDVLHNLLDAELLERVHEYAPARSQP